MPFLRSVSHSGPSREKLRWLTSMKRLGELSPAATHALVFFLTSTFWALIFKFILLSHGHQMTQSPSVLPYDLGHGHSIFHGTKFATCGHSLEDAESRGCEYDILANVRDHTIYCALLWKR
jgi:hypothetical protein